MMLDIRTVLVVGAITGLIVGALHLAAYATGRFARWPLWWGLGTMLVGLGGFGVAARGLIPDALSIQGANLAAGGGCLMLLAAMRSFADRPQHLVDYAVLLGFVGILMTLWHDPSDFVNRVVLMSALCAACDLAVAYESVRVARRLRLVTAWMMAGLFVLTATMFLVRAGLALGGQLGDELFVLPGPLPGWLSAFGGGLVILRSMSLLLVSAEHGHEILVAQAVRDPLTGAMNRGGLEDWLGRLARRPEAETRRIGVLLIDIDDFKRINDSDGHAAGDRVLQLLAEVAIAGLRPTDVLARQGGDEFVVILHDLQVPEAVRVAERLRLAFNAAVADLDERSIRPTLSIGVADGDLRSESFETIAARADAALYGSKRGGRDRVQTQSVAPLPQIA